MPVRFEASSEYNRNFKWFDSKKSRSHSPAVEDVLPPAGLKSEQLGTIQEPALQSKKHVSLASLSLETPYDDYFLVGDQSKFAKSIPYRSKSADRRMWLREQERSAVKTLSQPSATDQQSTPLGPKSSKHKPRQSRSQRREVSSIPNQKPLVEPKFNSQVKKSMKDVDIQTAVPEGNKARQLKSTPEKQRKIKASAHDAERLKPKVSHNQPQQSIKKASGDHREKRPTKSNEYVQTNIDKGVAASGQDDYGLMYRAGIAPPRPKGPKRQTEYMKQFQWKDWIGSSPMLAAEQVVHRSHPIIGPHGSSKPKQSEYRNQFKEWNLITTRDSGEAPSKKSKIQRSRSLEDLTPDQLPAAGIPRRIAGDNKRLAKESVNSAPYKRHGKLRYHVSEYDKNYQDPTSFEYKDGAWRGAQPPHIDGGTSSKIEGTGTASWFAEVEELRKKAAEYKLRAQGTHFSRQHTGQLYAREADLWESASTISALSLESASQRLLDQRKRAAGIQTELAREAAAQQYHSERIPYAWENGDVVEEATQTEGSEGNETERSQASTSTETLTGGSRSTRKSSEEGRITTPKMRELAVGGQRHHLDRTTPAIGGALLTSPPKEKYTASESSHSSMHAPRGHPLAGQPGNLRGSQLYNGRTPTYGMATRDSHALLDEEASTDRPLETHFVHTTPDKPSISTRRYEYAERNPGREIPPTITEDLADTYRSSSFAGSAADDDVMSVSAMSVASSSSLASEVLERAIKRRDEFWKN